jgi:hypothetical protein
MFEMAREGVDWWFSYYFDVELKDNSDSNGISLLYYACRHGQYTVAKWLLEHGANVNIQMTTKQRNTPLHSAKYYGHISIVELLLEYGADVNIKNDFGATIFDEAISDEVDASLSSRINELLLQYQHSLQSEISIDVEIDSHERDEEKPVVKLQIEDKSVCDDLLQTLPNNVCNVQDYVPVIEHSLDFQQTDTRIISAVSCVQYMNSKLVDTSLRLILYQTSSDDTYHQDTRQTASMFSEEKTISSYVLKFPFTDKRTFNSGDLTCASSVNCIQDDDTTKVTRFYSSDLRKYDLPNAICLLKTILSNNEKSDVFLLLLLAPISHQSDVRLYMLTMPLSHLFTSDTRSNQLSTLDGIHVPSSLKARNNSISSTCLTLREQETITFSHVDYHETNMGVIQSHLLDDLVLPDTVVSNGKRVNPSPNHIPCTLSVQDTSDFPTSIIRNPRVYYSPKILYAMRFTHDDQKLKAIRKRHVKRNSFKEVKCTIPISTKPTQITTCKPSNGELQIQRPFKSMPYCSSQRLILSPLLKWPQWLHLLHRIDI